MTFLQEKSTLRRSHAPKRCGANLCLFFQHTTSAAKKLASALFSAFSQALRRTTIPRSVGFADESASSGNGAIGCLCYDQVRIPAEKVK
ncbi:MAG TPA: hypothetical protein VJ572_09355 [Azonexus sp.]|nr:hypothetical protein [Azonexus sp.]